MTTLYDFSVSTNSHQQQSLDAYRGKVALIVNTASYCGFTSQYHGLQKLYEQYGQEKFVVLAFPCNQFAGQEPQGDQQIAEFCELNYQVTFPIFAKIEVNGEHCDPLYTFLKSSCPGLLGSEAIKWNFTKFLVDTNGLVVKRYASIVLPSAIAADIEKYLP